MTRQVAPIEPKQTVDEQVRAFYAHQALSPERAQEILDAAARKRGSRRRMLWFAAAALVLVMASGILLSSWFNARALGDRVAAEVVMNHRKDLSVEIAETRWPELGARLDKLGFALTEPRRLAAEYSLVGGRYCSIQAQLAAQLEIRHDSGRSATLYVTELSSKLASLPGTERQRGDVLIEVWEEGGLLYALARDSARGRVENSGP